MDPAIDPTGRLFGQCDDRTIQSQEPEKKRNYQVFIVSA